MGELLATQAKAQGAAAMLVDAAVRDVEELAELGLPIWARWVRVQRRGQGRAAARSASRWRSAARRSAQGDVVVLDADGVAVVEQERVEEVLAASRERAEQRARQARAARGWRALLRPRRPASARGGPPLSEPLRDLAHIGHAELLTPMPDESLRFFVDLFGMEIEAQEGQSVYLRGWGDYTRYSLKLTEAPPARAGPHGAFEPGAPRRSNAGPPPIEESGHGIGWIDGDLGHGPAYQFRDPDGHLMELYYETERYVPPEHLRPALKNVPQRFTGRGAAVKRLDHVNLLAADVEANRALRRRTCSATASTRRIELNDGTESGAWMSLSIMAHELIYVADHAGANGRLHHFAFWVDTREEMLRASDLFLDDDVPIEQSPSKHAVAQGFFLYVYEPGGNRVEVTSGGYLQSTTRTPSRSSGREAERARGQAWGVKTVESFHTYGTPPVSGEATGPPIPPTSRVPEL